MLRVALGVGVALAVWVLLPGVPREQTLILDLGRCAAEIEELSLRWGTPDDPRAGGATLRFDAEAGGRRAPQKLVRRLRRADGELTVWVSVRHVRRAGGQRATGGDVDADANSAGHAMSDPHVNAAGGLAADSTPANPVHADSTHADSRTDASAVGSKPRAFERRTSYLPPRDRTEASRRVTLEGNAVTLHFHELCPPAHPSPQTSPLAP